MEKKEYQFVVVGGGISGICAAIASARQGIKTALIQNRPVLGGNASSEIKMHICGADYHASKENARETGIIEEILLRNKYMNPQHSFSVLDTVLWEKVKYQENLDLYLNTHMNSVSVNNNKIVSINCFQMTTEKKIEIISPIFADATGDGTLAFLAGAEYMIGKEAKTKFNEKLGAEKYETTTMGNTLMFKALKLEKKIKFEKPFWANSYTEKDFYCRDHSNFDAGYWWIELGGDKLNTITDAEEIRDELLKAVYGIWDHIKNSGNHEAENYALDWVGFLPGKRESRRIIGDYILTESDLMESKIFDDSVAYGGWPMDIHNKGGFAKIEKPTTWNEVNGLYSIPYRCLYSKNIENLFIAGRNISASHVAFSSTRVMATCGVIGQAIGTAAGLLSKANKNKPKELLKEIKILQTQLQKDDCYILGLKDENHIMKNATVKASSFIENYEPENIINGYQRTIDEKSNCWMSSSDDIEQFIEINLFEKKVIKELVINFDSNLSKEIMITMIPGNKATQREEFPEELVKNYDIMFYYENNIVLEKQIKENIYRHNIHQFDDIECDKIKIKIKEMHSSKRARIFEVKAY